MGSELGATADPTLIEKCLGEWEPSSFEASTSSVWVRRFPAFVSECGVYSTSISIKGGDSSVAVFNYRICNGCQNQLTIPVAVVGSPGPTPFVQESPSAHGMWPIPEVIDEEGNRWVGACPVREVIVTGEQTRKVRLTNISPGQALEGYKERSLVGTLYHDPRNQFSQSRYWENPVDFNLISESAFLWPKLRSEVMALTLNHARSDAAICQEVGLPSEVPWAEGDEGAEGIVRQAIHDFELPEEISILSGE